MNRHIIGHTATALAAAIDARGVHGPTTEGGRPFGVQRRPASSSYFVRRDGEGRRRPSNTKLDLDWAPGKRQSRSQEAERVRESPSACIRRPRVFRKGDDGFDLEWEGQNVIKLARRVKPGAWGPGGKIECIPGSSPETVADNGRGEGSPPWMGHEMSPQCAGAQSLVGALSQQAAGGRRRGAWAGIVAEILSFPAPDSSGTAGSRGLGPRACTCAVTRGFTETRKPTAWASSYAAARRVRRGCVDRAVAEDGEAVGVGARPPQLLRRTLERRGRGISRT